MAVNRGGILERWTRERFEGGSEITAVDDNLSLPGRLERDEVDAFVTDSFEVEHFGRDGWRRRCEPPLDRKVFWIAPERAEELGPAVDRWIQRNERWLEARREEWFGRGQDRDELDHLLDLTARRLAFMPPVASWKSARGVPIEDLEQGTGGAGSGGTKRRPLRARSATGARLVRASDRPGQGGAAPDRGVGADVWNWTRFGRPSSGWGSARCARCGRWQAARSINPTPEDLEVLTPYLSSAEVERVRAGLARLLGGLELARAD